jgi:radical SAM family uncharacterized protein/radical SAM-linked protein
VRFCFAFPDVYEVGISHLGLKILYTIVNDLDYAMADRTYLPWLDALDLMRQDRIPLFTLEGKHRVSDFDVLGITLQSELTFTNVLELIDLSGIPIHSSSRNNSHPVVIAGGPCASNPLPLKPFIDAFLIGEGEEAIEEIVEVIRSSKKEQVSRFNRNDVLKRLAQIRGMYVPSVHDKLHEQNKKPRVRIRKYSAFVNNLKTHTPQLMPWQLATHNRYVAEIMRGCTRGCRFCHAGYFYRPVRERSPEQILDSLLQEIEDYGWEEAGLISLSSSDYTCIKPLLEALLKKIDQAKTHVSLPSLRVDSFDDTLISLLKEIGREGLTIAPEAGTQRLRNTINKNLSAEEILSGVRIARELGWQRIKLYFMIGLPTETNDDIQGIIDLINQIINEAGKRFQINVSISPFVPKAHTPFQWSAMLDRDELLSRVLLVKHAFQRFKFVKIRYHTIESSMLEAVLSRGNESAAAWIEQAWKNGARYDGWNEGFNWEYWTDAARDTGYDYQIVLQGFGTEEALPWNFIDLGVEKTWLAAEWLKALNGIMTMDCREGCVACGVCDNEIVKQTAQSNARLEKELSSLPVPASKEHPGIKSVFIKSWHYRLIYRKGGDFRFIGHLDWMRMVFRLMGRSRLPVVYTQGFNPHPKVSFSPALGVGITGENEYLDFFISIELAPDEIAKSLKSLFIGGLELKEIIPLTGNVPHIQPVADELVIIVPPEYMEFASEKIPRFEAAVSFPFVKQKKDGERTYDLKQVVISFSLKNNEMHIIKQLQSPNIYELLSMLLDLDKDELYSWETSRTGFIFPD